MILDRAFARCSAAAAAVLLAGAVASCGDDRILTPGEPGTPSAVTISSDPCATPVSVTLNTTVNGTIAGTDCLLSRGTYADLFTFTIGNGGPIRIHMSSDALDAYVIVTSSSGAQWIDDDSGPGTGARLEATLTAGTYTVRATSKAAGGSGAYRLWVGRDAPPGIDTITLGTYGKTVDGSITHNEWLMPRGTYADVYRFVLGTATAVRVNMMGDGFKPYILLRGISNTSSFTSDTSVAGNNAEVRASLQAGTYEIRASSAAPEGSGAYRLWVGPSAPPMTSIALGDSPLGTVTTSDWLLPRRTYGDVYSLTLSATTSLRVAMVSEGMAAYLTVFDGTTSYTDGDTETTNHARVIQSLPAGTYQIRATTASPGESGTYRLFVDSEHTLPSSCSRAPVPTGYVVVGTSTNFGCPQGVTPSYNEYLLAWPYGDEALEICSTVSDPPGGWVITSAASRSNCPDWSATVRNTEWIKIPGQTEEICSYSPVPAGYTVISQDDSPACPNWSAGSNNTRIIQRS